MLPSTSRSSLPNIEGAISTRTKTPILRSRLESINDHKLQSRRITKMTGNSVRSRSQNKQFERSASIKKLNDSSRSSVTNISLSKLEREGMFPSKLDKSSSLTPRRFSQESRIEDVSTIIGTSISIDVQRVAHPLSQLVLNRNLKRYSAEEMEKMLDDYQEICPEYKLSTLSLLPDFKKLQLSNMIYAGQYPFEKRNGKGISIHFEGRIYEGEWEDNEKTGFGTEISTRGNFYQGYFYKGRPQGYGTYRWNNGEYYKGEWSDGIPEGYGEWYGPDSVYKGDLKYGKPHGQGTRTWTDGRKYQGNFVNGQMKGYGKLWMLNGDFIQGNFVGEEPYGVIELYMKNGCYFKGELKNYKKEGQGLLILQNGERYEGDFKDDLKEGYGVYTWPSGNHYKGTFVKGTREGVGEMVWVDGSIYRGDWKRGVQHGQGRMFYFPNKLLMGEFNDNCLVDGETITDEAIIAEFCNEVGLKSSNSKKHVIEVENENGINIKKIKFQRSTELPTLDRDSIKKRLSSRD